VTARRGPRVAGAARSGAPKVRQGSPERAAFRVAVGLVPAAGWATLAAVPPSADHAPARPPTLIDARPRDLGGFTVGRVLPWVHRRAVGPFVFFDHMGPSVLPPGQGIDVRPHPHIELATVTYLFDGEIDHRDSLGVHQTIHPGAINLMIAGSGIVHSERSGPAFRERGGLLHGLQLWLGLPTAEERRAPSFEHHPAHTLPALAQGDVALRVLLGQAYGVRSPVTTLSPMFYVEARMPAGSRLALPQGPSERAAYVVDGRLDGEPQPVGERHMLVFDGDDEAHLLALTDARVMLLGGEPLDGPRHMFWNFVSSRPERIEQAKRDWAAGRFPPVPGDEHEWIPLPE
jgi:redox-sensitive bicupin YhaK (pirin superfamily)